MVIQQLKIGTTEVISRDPLNVAATRTTHDNATIVYRRPETNEVILELDADLNGNMNVKFLDRFFWSFTLIGAPTTESEISSRISSLTFDVFPETRTIAFRPRN